MCEMRVTLLEEQSEEIQFEGVTSLEFTGDSVAIHSFFETPKTLPHIIVDKIDCLSHAVVLRRVATHGLAGAKS